MPYESLVLQELITRVVGTRHTLSDEEKQLMQKCQNTTTYQGLGFCLGAAILTWPLSRYAINPQWHFWRYVMTVVSAQGGFLVGAQYSNLNCMDYFINSNTPLASEIEAIYAEQYNGARKGKFQDEYTKAPRILNEENYKQYMILLNSGVNPVTQHKTLYPTETPDFIGQKEEMNIEDRDRESLNKVHGLNGPQMGDGYNTTQDSKEMFIVEDKDTWEEQQKQDKK